MMNFPRKAGFLLIVVAALAAAGEWFRLELPSLRWFFSFGATPDQIEAAGTGTWSLFEWRTTPRWLREHQGGLIGYAACVLMALGGLVMILRGGKFHWNPLTLRKAARFRSIGRGYRSYKLLLCLVGLALLDQALMGKRALVVRHEGRWHFPAFQERSFSWGDFGLEGEEEVDFRQLKARLKESDPESLVILPPVPWDPTFDSDGVLPRTLPVINGRIHTPNGRQPYSGYAVNFQKADPAVRVKAGSIRNGSPQGRLEIYDPAGELTGREIWKDGAMVSSTVPDSMELAEAGSWVQLIYPPAPPNWKQRHYLGTDSKGWDILAQLYGGLQVVFKASVLFLLLTYGAGIVIGSMMGYFGGGFDLVMQRVMEVMINVPFLLVVLIITSNIGRDNISLTTILIVFCLFSWINVAIYLRTATYREKARDYANAARVLGAGTSRVIFRHILPNAIATIVTLVPFSVSAVVSSLTALDFLGFGVPDSYPSWGRILNDGVSNLDAVWIVSSVFGMMVFLLLLITFIGEAVREAFDPKKFTTYQ